MQLNLFAVRMRKAVSEAGVWRNGVDLSAGVNVINIPKAVFHKKLRRFMITIGKYLQNQTCQLITNYGLTDVYNIGTGGFPTPQKNLNFFRQKITVLYFVCLFVCPSEEINKFSPQTELCLQKNYIKMQDLINYSECNKNIIEYE